MTINIAKGPKPLKAVVTLKNDNNGLYSYIPAVSFNNGQSWRFFGKGKLEAVETEFDPALCWLYRSPEEVKDFLSTTYMTMSFISILEI